MNVRELMERLETVDPTMDVRIAAPDRGGPLVATFIAVAKQRGEENVIILSTHQATDAMKL
jgi:hypothetical protein